MSRSPPPALINGELCVDPARVPRISPAKLGPAIFDDQTPTQDSETEVSPGFGLPPEASSEPPLITARDREPSAGRKTAPLNVSGGPVAPQPEEESPRLYRPRRLSALGPGAPPSADEPRGGRPFLLLPPRPIQRKISAPASGASRLGLSRAAGLPGGPEGAARPSAAMMRASGSVSLAPHKRSSLGEMAEEERGSGLFGPSPAAKLAAKRSVPPPAAKTGSNPGVKPAAKRSVPPLAAKRSVPPPAAKTGAKPAAKPAANPAANPAAGGEERGEAQPAEGRALEPINIEAFRRPDYAHMSEEDKMRYRYAFRIQFLTLQQICPKIVALPNITDATDLNALHALYEASYKQTMDVSPFGKIRMFLVLFFLVVEYAGTRFGLKMGGFAMRECRKLSMYDPMLLEISKSWGTAFGEGMSPEWRLLFTAGASAIVYLVAGWISTKLGENSKDFFLKIGDGVVGMVVPGAPEPAEGAIAADGWNIGSVGGMLGGILNWFQGSGTKPATSSRERQGQGQVQGQCQDSGPRVARRLGGKKNGLP